MIEKIPQQPQPYKVKLKLFGERAERVLKNEYDLVVQEILYKFSEHFYEIRPAEQLQDKESFGDLDFICLSKGTIDELYFQRVLGDNLLEYHCNGHVHSILIKLASGKQVHTDFIQSKNENDFERKYMYYSKGHVSSIIGMFAKKLGFKYGTDGFFKRFQDKRGNWHDILVSESLSDGLAIMGLENEVFNNIHIVDDIVNFIAQSPFFDSDYFGSENMARKDRESIKRNSSQDYVVQKLREKNRVKTAKDENELLEKLFPEQFLLFKKEGEKINNETYASGAINGKKIMEVFNIKPGPEVGKILKFISNNYPEAEDLSEEIIRAVKGRFLI